jgi:MtN3 and saliva related transmembrane protein
LCDAGEPNQLSETIGNLGLWTRLVIPTKATRFKTHQMVRFFFGFLCFFDFCVEGTACAGRAVFILVGAHNSNPIPPHDPKAAKTVMQIVMRCGIIYGKQRNKIMNPIIGEILGYACGACTTIAFLPQAIKSIISKDVSGLSLSMYVIYCIGLIFWVLYGVYLESFQIILFNSITLIFNSIILYMIITNQRHKK